VNRTIDGPPLRAADTPDRGSTTWRTEMGEPKVGEEFIKHEFDEAIAIQEAIVEAEKRLSRSHPVPEAQEALKGYLKEDQQFLKQLQQLGRKHGATGEVEEVAGAFTRLMEETTQSASEAQSEAYEAHAVLLSLKRKQQDSAAAMLKMGRKLKDTELRDAAREFEKAQRDSSKALSGSLADFAVTIATQDQQQGARA
jgi:hypothetical protein